MKYGMYSRCVVDITRNKARSRTGTISCERASMATDESICLTAEGYASDPLIRIALAVQISLCLCTFVLAFKLAIKARRNQVSIHSNLKVKCANCGSLSHCAA